MNYETIIVGAGPAGLQLGYFLQKGGHSYCILERAPIAASFFDRYPHSGKLISINKKYTGTDVHDFNLRHDWNSLLNDEKMTFTSYSDDYYPAKDDLVRYMNDFAGRFKLNINYNHTVKKVYKSEEGGGYKLTLDVSGTEISAVCKKLVVATGLSKPLRPQLFMNTKVEPKHYADYPKDYFKKPENLQSFRNKSVCIFGNGNSAYELGNLLTPYASHIIINGRSQKAWAGTTHYTGDLRSIYFPFFDTFLLKSLNAIERHDLTLGIEQLTEKDPYHFFSICSPMCSIKHTLGYKDTFDHVIFCTGWAFDDSIFQFPVRKTPNNKYPFINKEYESVNNDGLFFIGALGHSHDYKESSGGFIHGFRYLIDYFYKLHYKKELDIETFDLATTSLKDIVDHIMYRINYTSAMYQMYGQLGDIFFFDRVSKQCKYFNSVPTNIMMGLMQTYPTQTFFRLTLNYGDKKIEKIGDLDKQESKEPALARFLHPIVEVYRTRPRGESEGSDASDTVLYLVETIHFAEDIFVEFTNIDRYYNKFIRIIKGYAF